MAKKKAPTKPPPAARASSSKKDAAISKPASSKAAAQAVKKAVSSQSLRARDALLKEQLDESVHDVLSLLSSKKSALNANDRLQEKQRKLEAFDKMEDDFEATLSMMSGLKQSQ